MKKKAHFKYYTPQEFNQSNKKRAYASKDIISELNFNDDTSILNTPQKDNDRFIPQRNPNFISDIYHLRDKIENSLQDISQYTPKEQNKLIYSDILQHEILSFDDYLDESDKFSISSKNQSTKSKKKLFNFSNKKESQKQNDLLFDKSNQIKETQLLKKIKETRKISKIPYKTLDAPGVQDNISTSLLDWSCKSFISIALDNSIYLWNKSKKGSGNTEEITKDNKYKYTTLKFSKNGLELAAGEQDGFIHIYDINTQQIICDIKSQLDSITSIDWLNNNQLAIGSKDNSIKIYDRKSKKFIANIFQHHDEVLTIKWDYTKNYLASSGLDNKIFIWNLKTQKIFQTYQEHKSPVKGLDWSPHNYGILTTGEISGNKSIKFWQINHKNSIHTIKTENGICNLLYSQSNNQLLTTHNKINNNMAIWNCDNKERITILQGHSKRIFHLALSPNQNQLVSCSSDETLKFWKIFPKKKKQKMKDNFLNGFFIELRQLIKFISL